MTTKPTKASADATTRALMALVSDLVELTEATNRVRTQIQALATRHGVPLPLPAPLA
jgi:hypothetical protein